MANTKHNSKLEARIREAISKLMDAGSPVTNETVRKALEGGSFRDIGPIVKMVKAEIVAKEEAARAAPPMPEDFSDAANAMWDLTWRLADELAAAERHGHAMEVDRLKAETDEALANCGLVEDERDAAELRADETAKLLAAVEAELLQAKFEIASLKGQLAEREKYVEARIAELKATDTAEKAAEVRSETSSVVSADKTKASPGDTQMDMFSRKKSAGKDPEATDPIAAE
ncbi:DNA-binding protein [uncultured Sulfitobacter sp.]|uniref:DNA-binding protein n=1 Tax=uncultured Sulfitobacter sp. TaxID=191468 RepID=UPI0030DA3069